MSTPAQTSWRMAGEEAASCNCAWGCPCQFNALPTHGRCEAFVGFQIREGHFGTTRLDGVRFAFIFWWPGPMHEGHGTRQLIIDEQATPNHGVQPTAYSVPSCVAPAFSSGLDPAFSPRSRSMTWLDIRSLQDTLYACAYR